MEWREYLIKQISNSITENIKSLREFMQTACIISGALASFSMLLLQYVNVKELIIAAISFFLLSISVGLYRLKVIIEEDDKDLRNLQKWLIENNMEKLKGHLNRNKIKSLDYTPDFIVYPIIGGMIAIFLAFVFQILK